MKPSSDVIFAGKCGTCNCSVWLPNELYLAATKSNKVHFYCGYGHQLYLKFELELQKVEGNIVPFVKKGG